MLGFPKRSTGLLFGGLSGYKNSLASTSRESTLIPPGFGVVDSQFWRDFSY